MLSVGVWLSSIIMTVLYSEIIQLYLCEYKLKDRFNERNSDQLLFIGTNLLVYTFARLSRDSYKTITHSK